MTRTSFDKLRELLGQAKPIYYYGNKVPRFPRPPEVTSVTGEEIGLSSDDRFHYSEVHEMDFAVLDVDWASR